MKPEERPDEFERALAGMNPHEPDDALWPRIEESLRKEQVRAVERPEGFLSRLALMFRVPVVNLGIYAAILVVGVVMSWMLLSDYRQRQETMDLAQSNDEIMLDAQSDIQQAIFFYERAIEKLTVLAERNEQELDPAFVKLQKEKIELLRASITECKDALRINGAHPEVQHYLFAAYTDLQHTLQQMVSRTQ